MAGKQTTALFLIGTRPELIKLAPVLWACDREDAGITPVVCFTGQHRELVDELAPRLGIAPDYQLGAMRPGQDLLGLTTRLLSSIDVVVDSVCPDIVVGQGDTTTVLAGALAAFYRRVPFAHVEAGLRTADVSTPFPEEANRRMVSVLASCHFAPTARAAARLLEEGVSPTRVRLVGNTVVDAVRTVARSSHSMPPERRRIVLTMHRRESFGGGLSSIARAVRTIATAWPDVDIIWPVHPNPAVQAVAHTLRGMKNVTCVPPLNYPEMVELIAGATLLLTDSGGLQEEGPSLRVPVLVLRDETERPEGVAAGVARLVGTDEGPIVDAVNKLLGSEVERQRMMSGHNPYGDGNAGARIAAVLPEIAASGWSFGTETGTLTPGTEHMEHMELASSLLG